MNKKVLIIGDVNHTLIKEFVETMKNNYEYSIDILNLSGPYKRYDKYFDRLYSVSMPVSRGNKNIISTKMLYFSYWKIIKDIVDQLEFYDVIHIHYLNPMYRYFIRDLRKKAGKLNITIWGSDYYRISEKQKKKNKKLFDISNTITFANEQMKRDFLFFYNSYHDKVKICRFGLKTLEEVNKLEKSLNIELKKKCFLEKYNIPEKKYVVTCGYNASSGQQHEKIIESLGEIPEKFLQDILFLFPLAYGDEVYRDEVINLLNNSKINYKVLTEYFENEETALLRSISDIMINVQISDQFSGSMQEALYAGNILINGSWLPYDIFKHEGGYFLEIDSLKELSGKIEYCIENIITLKDKTRNNKSVIWKLSSWENNKKDWYDVYGQ